MAKEQHSAACIIIDKGDKVPLSALQEQLQSLLPGLSPATIAELLVTLQVWSMYSVQCNSNLVIIMHI